jgi:hypothetical protein
MDAALILDSIMKNVSYDDPVKLAEWRTARHVRSAKRAAPTPPPPPPNP